MKLLECLQQRTKSALQCQLRRFLLSRAASRLCSLSSSLIAARRISLFSRSTPKSLDSGGTGISSSPFFSVDEYYLCALRNAVLAADSHGYVDHALAGYCSCLQSPFTISYYKFHILKNSYGEMFVTSSNEQIEQGFSSCIQAFEAIGRGDCAQFFPIKKGEIVAIPHQTIMLHHGLPQNNFGIGSYSRVN